MPGSHHSNGSAKSEIPTYEEAIEPVNTHPVEINVQAKGSGERSPDTPSSSKHSSSRIGGHGAPEVIGDVAEAEEEQQGQTQERSPRLGFLVGRGKGWFKYMKTKEFWIVLLLGQVLSVCLTATNTFSELLAEVNTNIPAFQTFFNYVLLNIIYTSYTLYKYGFKKWTQLIWKDGWKYFLLAFCDVEGNYFIVLAYRYTTILSVQLIDFWAIVVVVLISLIFLHVRYRITQYAGIVVCIGGMGLLIGSDHITGANSGQALDAVKGDLFALLGATFYGFSNTFEEFAVSKRPMYEVIGQMSFWGMFINGVQAGIFDRNDFKGATWNGQVAGYFVGYTLILALFYSLAPLVFRMSSAAFFNISLLTSDFWGVCVGVTVFHLSVYYLYPIAFVMIIVGMFVYFLTEGVMGEAEKPWLGQHQEKGVAGIGTARQKAEARAGAAGEGAPGPGAV